MKVIPREAGRTTYSASIRALKGKSFSEIQRAIIVGCILGDGHLSLNWSKTNYSLRIAQSVKQQDYVAWKYAMLSDFVLSGPRYKEINKSVSFATISHSEITKLGQLFYRKNKKIIPSEIDSLLSSPLTIAIWFMDDGNCIRRNGKIYGYHLNTQSYTEKENNVLAEAMKRLYGIRFNLEKNHGQYRLRIMQKIDREKFSEIIKPYILPSLQYKIV